MFLRVFLIRACLGLLVGSVCAASTVQADVSIDSTEVSVGHVTKPGVWTRLAFTLSSTVDVDCRVEAVATDPSGCPATFPSKTLELQAQSSLTGSLYFVPGRLRDTISVRVVSLNGELLAVKRLTSTEAVTDSADFQIVEHSVPIWLMVGTIGSSQPLKSGRQPLQKEFADRGVHVTQLESSTDFPDHWQALSAFDTVILAGSFDFSAAQSSALDQWIQQGGHAAVIVGTRVDELKASPIADWALDGRSLTGSSLSDLSGLEAAARSSFRIPIVSRIKGSVITAPDGTNLVTSIDGALMTRSAYGFGRITLLGVDVDRPPLSRWRSLDSFVATIADLPSTASDEESTAQRISHSGITELATQLQIGMETIPHIGQRSTLTVLGLVLLFLLMIGPLDYFLVHRVLKRPGLTWVTFPTIVIAFGLVAATVAAGANGRDLRCRMCELIDVDAESGFVRKTVWSAVYSPEHRRYQVQVDHVPDALIDSASADETATSIQADESGWLRWTATPESNFGGMYRPAGLNLGGAGYQFSENPSTIENLPIPAASARILTSCATSSVSPRLFELNLKQAGTGHLSRDSTFAHHLPGPIEDWVLVYGNRVYFHDFRGGEMLGSSAIEPGMVWSATGKTTGGRELKSFLTGSTFQRTGRKRPETEAAEFEYAQVEWNRRDTDLQKILRMLTFHRLAGGRDYTGLNNFALSDFELSDSLPLDRAVLFGRLTRPAATIHIDGQRLQPDQQESFIRVLLRVEDAPIELNLPKFEK